MVVIREESFDDLFRRLLAMIDRGVKRTGWQRTNLASGDKVVARLDEPRMNEVTLGLFHR